jgi:competence protein ComEA
MVTADERRALLFLAVVIAAGGAVRLARSSLAGPGQGDTAPGAALVAPERQDPALTRQLARLARAESLARPLRPGERIDVDRAGAEELERLPGVGPALARRIMDDRAARGPFGSLAGLDRVRGIGPALLEQLEPWVRFSGVARAVEVQQRKRVGARRRPP